MRVLVTDAAQGVAYDLIRWLGRKGVEVIAVEQKIPGKFSTVGFLSKYCKESLIVPSCTEAPDLFLEKLKDILKSQQIDVLIPTWTETYRAIAKDRKVFEQYTNLLLPAYDKIAKAEDKGEMLRLASSIDIPIPKTYSVHNINEVKRIANEISYPVVIKLTRQVDFRPAQRYFIARDDKELLHHYRQLDALQSNPLIQEYIEGDAYGFFALFDRNSKPKAIFCHKRIREHPISGGPSTFCESIRDEQLIEYGIRLLTSLKWQGVAMVEFKRDRRDHLPKLMEVNPRFWGSLPLAIISGVNFPYLLCKLATGDDFQPVMDYKVGVKVRFLQRDLLAAKQYLFRGEFKRVGQFLRDLFNFSIKEGTFSLDDPKPMLYYLAEASSLIKG